VARSLEVVGDRWTLLVVRELLLGGRRWAELERALPGIPSNLLAERLRLLEEEGVVERATEGRVYHLTDKGRDLAPVLASLAAWGTRHCGEPSSAVATHAGCGGRVVMRSSCARCGAPVQAGARFPVNFYIAYFPQQGASGGWRVARVLALDRDGRTIAHCRTKDTCAED